MPSERSARPSEARLTRALGGEGMSAVKGDLKVSDAFVLKSV